MESKETCKNYIQKTQRFINSGDYEEAAINVRHFLETISTDLIRQFAPDHVYDDTFHQIEALNATNRIDKSIIDALHGLRKLGNKGGHINGTSGSISLQELSDVIPVMIRLLKIYDSSTADSATNNATLLLMERWFNGRTMYDELIYGGKKLGGVTVSFNNRILKFCFPNLTIHASVIGINQYNVLQFDSVTINATPIPLENMQIRIGYLTLKPDKWGNTIGDITFEFKTPHIPRQYLSTSMQIFLQYKDIWKGEHVKMTLMDRIKQWIS